MNDVIREKIELYKINKDIVLRNEIVLEYMWIAVRFSDIYSNLTGIESCELESFAYEGLIYAIEHFDPSVQENLEKYIRIMIREYILRGVAVLSGYTGRLRNFYWNYIRCKNQVETSLNTTLEEDTELVIENILDLLVSSGIIMPSVRGLYRNLIFLKERSLLKYYSNLNTCDQKDEVDCFEKFDSSYLLHENLEMALAFLREKERMVLISRYGLEDGEMKTLAEVGKRLQLTHEGVRRLESNAFLKIRTKKATRDLKEYL